ncbi:MAG: helix-turn-helix domain-containing protein [Verrucomicrobiota bacterium]
MVALVHESHRRALAAPTPEDTVLARSAARSLAHTLDPQASAASVRLVADGDATETVEVPASALRLFLQILTQMAEGNAVTLVPVHHELTTQEAADLLNVSRPYLIRQLEAGKIPFNRVGNRRRVRFKDLLAYKAEQNRTREDVLQELAAQAQELGMGY